MFYFTDDCILGVEKIDEEHKYLFELMGKIIQLCESEYLSDRYNQINDVIEELQAYADRHFQDEEAYMLQIRDPELIRQRAQHNYFRRKVDELSVQSIAEDDEQERIIKETVHFLAKWLYGHIIASDLLIGKLPPIEEWMLRENPCEFTLEYQTGIDLIDNEHKELFAIMGKIDKLVKERVSKEDLPEVNELLQRLKKYTIDHFRDEEEYMESIHYEAIEAQKRAHQAFAMRMEEIHLDENESNLQEEMQSLVEFLLGWLVNHIVHMDKKIGN